MKKFSLFGLALCLLANLAHANLTLVQTITQGSKPPLTMTTKIKGTQARMDINPEMTSIIDFSSGETKSLIHPQKAVVTIPAAMMQQLKQQMASQSDLKISELKPTGKKETINGFACEEYEAQAGDTKLSLWLTKDFPNEKDILAQLSQTVPENDPIGSILRRDLPGFPIRTVMKGAMGEITSTLVSLNQDDVADSEFAVPADYKPMSMPGLPQ